VVEWIHKQDPYICCLQETHFRPQDTYRLKVRGWKNIFHANGKQKKAGITIFISDKIDLKIKKITRDKEGHYITIKGINQRGRHNNYKCLCTQHRSTSIYKTKTNRHKMRN
jgi:exonuclease III